MLTLLLRQFGVDLTTSFYNNALVVFAVLVVLWVIVTGTQSILLSRQIADRPTQIADLATQFPEVSYEIVNTDQILPDTLRQLGKKSWHVKNLLHAPEWDYLDYSYDVYRENKYGEYKDSTIHYSVLVVSLPRSLPRMIFDAPKSHGSQYKFQFHEATRHSLEGNFDKHFTTYFPKQYSIDALSIISPEVMRAMIDAHEYDIEVSGDKLYLYGQLAPVENITGLIEKGVAIKQKLMNNIVTYRDERISFKEGRKETSSFGTYIQVNPFRYWSVFVLGAVLSVAGLVFYIRGIDFHQLLIYGIILMLAASADFYKVSRRNKQLDEQYAAATNYNKSSNTNQ